MGGIDQLFDLADDFIDAFEEIVPPTAPSSVAGGSTPAPAPARASAPTPSHGRDARSSPASTPKTTAVTRRRGGTFKVVEAFDSSNQLVWVVTDGENRAECSSSEFAQRVRDALG